MPKPVVAEAPAPEPVAASGPNVHHYPDGSTLSTEHTKKGWKAICDTGISGVAAEVFYGATESEMWQNVAAGKINATKKIREQNRAAKLEAAAEVPAVQPVVQPVAGELSADDIFEIRTALESNPDLALEKWFQKKFGVTASQLVSMVQKGSVAADELDAESESRDFLSGHSDYYVCQQNLFNVSAYLAKKFLKVTQTAANAGDLYNRLVSGGYWTNTNLSGAYDELNESGLLEFAPVAAEPETEPEPETVVQPAPRAAEPVTPPQDERIVRSVRRPRAGLGLRSTETTTVRTAASEKPPSADDLDNLSDAEVNKLFADTRRHALTSRR